VTIAGLKLTRVHKADLVPPRIGAKNPGNFFHLSEGRSIAIRESGTRRDWEGDPAVAARELGTLNDPLMKTDSLDDRRMATGEAEGSSPFLDRAPANLETHGLASSLGAFHEHLLSVGLLHMGRHDTTALCRKDGHHCFKRCDVAETSSRGRRRTTTCRRRRAGWETKVRRVGRSPAAPDAERSADSDDWDRFLQRRGVPATVAN